MLAQRARVAPHGHRGRAELFSVPFREYVRQVRQQFADMFSGSGFNPKTDIAGIILNRWGRAYLTPPPGFFFGKMGGLRRGILAGSPVRHDCIREYRFVGSGRSSFVDHRGQSCSRTVARSGSQL